jgi:hypothetical protein
MLKYFEKIKKQRGSSLLLALFVMGAMVVVGLGTASLSINQIKQSREIKKSTIAFYTAEAGIEEALYEWRKDVSVEKIEDLWGHEVVPFTNNATSSLSFFDQEEEIFDQLKVNEIVSLDLYNKDDLSASTNIRSISLEWDGKPSSWLEVTWKSLNDPLYYSDDVYIQKRYFPYGDGSMKIVDLTAGLGQSSSYKMHVVQIKALYDEVKNLRIKAYTDSGGNNQTDIPSRIYIASLGEYPKDASNRARYNITVSMPEKIPLSPLFDFVIFSEADLTKTIIEVGSKSPKIMYVECGPYLYSPDCNYVFRNSASQTFTVEGIGILPATIIDAPYIDPPGLFQILPSSTCDESTQLEYGETCILDVRPLATGQAELIVPTSTEPVSDSLKMMLYYSGR